MRRALIAAGLVLSLAIPTWLVIQKERVLSQGTPMLLALAPVDPRSLIQGDYMRLRYAIVTGARTPLETAPDDGRLVVRLDDDGVATLVRVHDASLPLGDGERLLRYRRRSFDVRLGAESYFFQEGQADLFAGAKFGELRVAPDGDSVLVGLRDAARAPLGPSRKRW